MHKHTNHESTPDLVIPLTDSIDPDNKVSINVFWEHGNVCPTFELYRHGSDGSPVGWRELSMEELRQEPQAMLSVLYMLIEHDAKLMDAVQGFGNAIGTTEAQLATRLPVPETEWVELVGNIRATVTFCDDDLSLWIVKVNVPALSCDDDPNAWTTYKVRMTEEEIYVQPSGPVPRDSFQWRDYMLDNIKGDVKRAAIMAALAVHLDTNH
jgi:hypothetical protein